MGGLSKKAFQFGKTVNNRKLPHLTLDGGALLFKGLKLTNGQEEQERLTAETIARSYDLMGYNAVGVSANDLTAGLDFLVNLSREVKFSWLSANLVQKSTLKPVFKDYIIVPVGNLDIAVIGLTNNISQSMLSADTIILPWEKVLKPLLTKLTPQTDMIILLSNLPQAQNRKIAEQFKNIHIILQSGHGGGNIHPKPQDNTLITQTARQGKYIGIMNINWRDSKHWGIDKAAMLKKEQAALGRLNWQISKYEKHGDPLKSLKDRPGKLQVYQRLLKKRQNSNLQISRLKQEIKANNDKKEPCTFDNRFIAMETTLPDDHRVKNIVDKLNKEINLLGKAKAKVNKSLHKKYSGWRSCGKCHPKILAAWQQTRHATAYETLVIKKRQFNIDCLYCHVTGVRKDQAVDALSVDIDLREVGCEACHGSGKKHIRDPEHNKLEAKPAESLCITCHTVEHDGSFSYEKASKLVH